MGGKWGSHKPPSGSAGDKPPPKPADGGKSATPPKAK